jgi:two-component system, OmpR family, sensor kinase
MTPNARPLASVLTRRLVWIAIAVVFVNAIAVAAYYGSDREALEREVIAREMSRLEAALDGDPPRVDQRARGLFETHPRDYAFALLDRNGGILDAENAGLIPPQATETGVFAQDWVTRLVAPEGPVLVAAHKISASEDELRLVFVMADDSAGLLLRALVAEFAKHIWLPILPVALILIGANAFMIRRGLKPVASAAEWARSIRPGMPAPPLLDRRLPAEITDLVDATQRSLERLNVALAAEKRRAAEAAHALRTPVAVLVARLDALPPGETTDRLRADLAALSRTVSQVLACARADALDAVDASRTDLGRAAGSVTAALAPFAYERGVELSLSQEEASVIARADPDGVELALSNIVENAILHAGTGPVEIEVGPGPTIRVRDHGPGLPPGARASLFEPFWRGDGAAPGGAGLGLAIVERLQRAQGGTVDARNLEGGGAEFVLSFRRW